MALIKWWEAVLQIWVVRFLGADGIQENKLRRMCCYTERTIVSNMWHSSNDENPVLQPWKADPTITSALNNVLASHSICAFYIFAVELWHFRRINVLILWHSFSHWPGINIRQRNKRTKQRNFLKFPFSLLTFSFKLLFLWTADIIVLKIRMTDLWRKSIL